MHGTSLLQFWHFPVESKFGWGKKGMVEPLMCTCTACNDVCVRDLRHNASCVLKERETNKYDSPGRCRSKFTENKRPFL